MLKFTLIDGKPAYLWKGKFIPDVNRLFKQLQEIFPDEREHMSPQELERAHHYISSLFNNNDTPTELDLVVGMMVIEEMKCSTSEEVVISWCTEKIAYLKSVLEKAIVENAPDDTQYDDSNQG